MRPIGENWQTYGLGGGEQMVWLTTGHQECKKERQDSCNDEKNNSNI